MTEFWYYAEGAETRGPLSLDELLPMLARIADPRQVMIWRHGFEDWKAVEEVRELAQHYSGHHRRRALLLHRHRPFASRWSTRLMPRNSKT